MLKVRRLLEESNKNGELIIKRIGGFSYL